MLLCEVNKTTKSILVRNYCQVASCGKRDIVRIRLMETFVQNFAYIVSPLNPTKDSLNITTTTREGIYYLDTANSNVFIDPELVPNNLILASPEILRTNNIINKRVAWVFSFKTSKNAVPKGGYVTITIPKDVMLTVDDSILDILNYDNMARYWNTLIKYYPTSN